MKVQPSPTRYPLHKKLRSETLLTTTNQSELFPVRTTGNQQFRIKDDFLYACITYGDGLAQKPFRGFTWTKGIGYAFLTFFAQKAFGIHRFPFFPDRIFADHPSEENQKTIIEAVQSLTPGRIDAICEELVSVYNHTQSLLEAKKLTRVRVTRVIKDIHDRPIGGDTYAQTIMRLKKAAQATGQATIQFEMDTINSWGNGGGFPHNSIMIRQTVPAADVLYFWNMIASRQIGSDAVEAGEWVVLNRSATGVIKIDVDDITFDEIYAEVPGWTSAAYENFLKTHSPFPFRKAARIDKQYVHPRSGWRLTTKGRLMEVLDRIIR